MGAWSWGSSGQCGSPSGCPDQERGGGGCTTTRQPQGEGCPSEDTDSTDFQPPPPTSHLLAFRPLSAQLSSLLGSTRFLAVLAAGRSLSSPAPCSLQLPACTSLSCQLHGLRSLGTSWLPIWLVAQASPSAQHPAPHSA